MHGGSYIGHFDSRSLVKLMGLGLDHVSGATESGRVAGAGCRSNQRAMADALPQLPQFALR
jgi:hypothetical protein